MVIVREMPVLLKGSVIKLTAVIFAFNFVVVVVNRLSFNIPGSNKISVEHVYRLANATGIHASTTATYTAGSIAVTQPRSRLIESVRSYRLSKHKSKQQGASPARVATPPHVRYVADLDSEKGAIQHIVKKQYDVCLSRWHSGQCPCQPPQLRGRMVISIDVALTYTWDDIAVIAGESRLGLGGTWQPSHCHASTRLLIIVPFRDRESHLKAFLAHMHPVLQRQQMAYRILVIEQRQPALFNKAATMNAGFAEAVSLDWPFDCVVFHDVDLLMEDDRNMVMCGQHVMHYGFYIDTFNYKPIDGILFGGIVAMTRQQITAINGFSNKFFGWGGEDDNAYMRVKGKNLPIARPPLLIGKYTAITHHRDRNNPRIQRSRSLLWNTTYDEGLSTISYDVVSEHLMPSFTHIVIDLNVTGLPYHFNNGRISTIHFEIVPGSWCPGVNIIGVLKDDGEKNFINRCMDLCGKSRHCYAFIMETTSMNECRMMAKSCHEQSVHSPDNALFHKGFDSELHELSARYEAHITDCKGNDIAVIQTGRCYKCAKRCEQMTSCQGFVIYGGQCFVKSACTPHVGGRYGNLRSYVRKSLPPHRAK